MNIELYNARFVRERKGRFLCEIEINGHIELAHIPNSAKLSKFINIVDMPILVKVNKGKRTKTKYQLVATKIKGKWILVNLNILNQLVKEYYCIKGMEVEMERYLEPSYRADLIIHGSSNIVCEVKGILSELDFAIFPKYSGIRTKKQMLILKKIIKNRLFEEVYYIFVIMNPDIKSIVIDKNNECYRIMKQCIKQGMKLVTFDVVINNYEIKIIESNKEIKI